ncbi:MAG: alpha-L-fucosidase [Candidatus Brocadiia bacterium]
MIDTGPTPIVSKESKNDPKLRWFDEARFGMFVHFGVSSMLKRGEWVMYDENIPRDEYKKLIHNFNPHKFDAEKWVETAENMGARYITITAKHHDGFCLFDSQLTDFKITNTPFGRDLIGELVEACHDRDMRIIFYYSQPDWHHPNFVHKKGAFKDLDSPPADQKPDWRSYQQYCEGQVRELVTHYGKIDGIWFDGSHKSELAWQGRKLYDLIKEHQPHAVVNDRGRFGDFYTPERSLPEDLSGYLFEACESIETEHWGYAPDSPLHNPAVLLESLIRMAAAGGNYLLNVGPKPDGTIPVEQVERLVPIGEWLGQHGESIYGTRECPIETGSEDLLATRNERTIYLHLLEWPETNRMHVPGVLSEPPEAEMLGSEYPVMTRLEETGLTLTELPETALLSGPATIALRFDEEPDLRWRTEVARRQSVIRLPGSGTVFLPAAEAECRGKGVKGAKIRCQRGNSGDYLAGWQTPQQQAVWRVDCPEAGRYRVVVAIACEDIYAGSRYVVRCGRSATRAVVEGTGGMTDFECQLAGEIEIGEGEQEVMLRPEFMPYGYLFANVMRLELMRLDTSG